MADDTSPIWVAGGSYYNANGFYTPTNATMNGHTRYLNAAEPDELTKMPCDLHYHGAFERATAYHPERTIGWAIGCRGYIRFETECHTRLPLNCSWSPRIRKASNPAPEVHLAPEHGGKPPTVGRNCSAPSVLPPLDVSRNSSSHARTIWMFWAQGWEKAPPLAKACAASWERLNPKWKVVYLSLECRYHGQICPPGSTHGHTRLVPVPIPMKGYRELPNEHSPHYSDIVRTELITYYGGLWVDATLCARKPIEEWLPLARASTNEADDPERRKGFFAVRYHADKIKDARGHGLHPHQVSNWLLYATTPGQLIPRLLRHNLQLFWARPHKISRTNVQDPNYFVWQEMFGCLVDRSSTFRDAFNAMPHLPGGDGVPDTFAEDQYCLDVMPLTDTIKATIDDGAFFKLSHKATMCKERRNLTKAMPKGVPSIMSMFVNRS